MPGVWLDPVAAAESARTQLAALPGLGLLQDKCCGAQQSVSGFDPLRLVLNTQGLGLSGYDAAAWLEQQHGIVPELATNRVSWPEVVWGTFVQHAAQHCWSLANTYCICKCCVRHTCWVALLCTDCPKARHANAADNYQLCRVATYAILWLACSLWCWCLVLAASCQTQMRWWKPASSCVSSTLCSNSSGRACK